MNETCKAMLGSVLFLAGASSSMAGAAQSMPAETLLAAAPDSSRSIVADPIRIVARRLPAYPVDARIDAVEGRVLLRYTVQTDGTVNAIETLDSQPPFVFTRRSHSEPARREQPPGTIGRMKAPTAPFADLTPDAVLNAIDQVGLVTTGTLLALNSYENRVFQVGVEDAQRFVVAKFYRPGRWTDAQILEEHAFTQALADTEVPAVPPLELAGRTLHERADPSTGLGTGHRFALYPRRGGRAPNLDQREVREWLGRFIGRIHAVGRAQRFVHRPALDMQTFGAEPSAYLIDSGWVPHALANVYAGVVAQALDEVRRCYERAGAVRTIRLHGDVHVGNVLWTDSGAQPGPHFVDFDDARTGPAVQDLWMLLSGTRDEMQAQLADLLAGYEEFSDFDRRELHLVEALRTLRLIHYAAWIARRWDDPAFPAAFPWFNTPRYWEERVLELREQIAAMAEPPLAA